MADDVVLLPEHEKTHFIFSVNWWVDVFHDVCNKRATAKGNNSIANVWASIDCFVSSFLIQAEHLNATELITFYSMKRSVVDVKLCDNNILTLITSFDIWSKRSSHFASSIVWLLRVILGDASRHAAYEFAPVSDLFIFIFNIDPELRTMRAVCVHMCTHIGTTSYS